MDKKTIMNINQKWKDWRLEGDDDPANEAFKDKLMFKLKEILKENKYAWERKFGEPLPTIEDTTRRHKGIQKITEKKELGGALINKIEQLTDRNNHTEARLTLARAVGDKKLVQAYEGIDAVHIYLRDMGSLSQARDRLDKKLFAQAKKVFSDYSIIMGAF